MAIAEHHPEEVSAENRHILSMDKGQLSDFASTEEVKSVRKHGVIVIQYRYGQSAYCGEIGC